MGHLCLRFWEKVNKRDMVSTKRRLSTQEKIKIIVSLLEEKKAEDILVLDVEGKCNFTDAFILCTGNSLRQIKTIAEHLEENLKPKGIRIYKNTRTGGDDNWVVLDCLDVVIHIFDPEARNFYRIERLWQDVESREDGDEEAG